jgi:hypothetical protein
VQGGKKSFLYSVDSQFLDANSSYHHQLDDDTRSSLFPPAAVPVDHSPKPTVTTDDGNFAQISVVNYLSSHLSFFLSASTPATYIFTVQLL